jgi:hypothetical protein
VVYLAQPIVTGAQGTVYENLMTLFCKKIRQITGQLVVGLNITLI